MNLSDIILQQVTKNVASSNIQIPQNLQQQGSSAVFPIPSSAPSPRRRRPRAVSSRSRAS